MSDEEPVIYKCYDCGLMFKLSEMGDDVLPTAELLTAVVLKGGVRNLYCAVCHKNSILAPVKIFPPHGGVDDA